MTLRELEKRLEREPDNLPLRVTVAGQLRDAGRTGEAVELYRSVAVAYRSQGRNQQAIAVCRSILELAPGDMPCRALLAELVGGDRGVREAPAVPAVGSQPESRRWSESANRPTPTLETPLPPPLPHHVYDPTASVDRISRLDPRELDLPVVEGADTRPGHVERGSDTTGLAEAARRISGLIARDTAPLPRGSSTALRLVDPADFDEAPTPTPVRASDLDEAPTPTPVRASDLDERPTPTPVRARDLDERPTPTPVRASDLDDRPTPAPARARDTDEDLTTPRELGEADPIANAFFTPLPLAIRPAALRRCSTRELAAGDLAIRRGEAGHPLILVAAGRLEVRAERADGSPLVLEVIEPGQYVGEAALLARTPAPAVVVAALDCLLIELPSHVLFELAGAYPALWAALKDTAERRARHYDRVTRASP